MDELLRITPVIDELGALFHKAGEELYLVGGSVRDALLGRLGHDLDFTTSADPDTTERLLHRFSSAVWTVGKEFGTIGASKKSNGHELQIEITTFRADAYEPDSRKPIVAYGDNVQDDLVRRDFTVNAMAWSPETGLVDPFGGVDDLRGKSIRCVGDPARRFQEDALRILRALRFSSSLGFSIEAETAAALRADRARLEKVSAERIAAELVKIVCGTRAPAVLREFPEVVARVLPGWDCDPDALGRAPADPAVRLAMLFSTEADAEAALRRLKFDRATIRAAKALLAFRTAPLAEDRPAVRRMLRKLGPAAFRRLLAMRAAYGAPLAGVARTLGEVLEEGDCWSLDALAVKGGGLLAAGVPAGPELGRTLAALLDAVIDGRCPNERAALLELVPPQ